MLIAAVVMAAVLGWACDEGPAELVAKLGSPRFAEREAAAESLRRLGDLALPALRKARSEQDLEIRTRAANLRDEIEAISLLKPTMVRLDFHDRPLSEVVEGIGRQAGVSLASGDEPLKRRKPQDKGRSSWPDRRITLEAADPLPFWEAIDRLCRAGGLRRLYPQHSYGLEEPFDRLILAPGEASPPRSDTGPFRVELLRICRERDLDLTPGLYPVRSRVQGYRASCQACWPWLRPRSQGTSRFELLRRAAHLHRTEVEDHRGSVPRTPARHR